MMTTTRVLVCSFGLVQLAAAAGAAIKTTPGELVLDPPTLINLGFEWLIEGDDNRNATVEVAYRRAGEVEWRQGFTGSAPDLGALEIGQVQPHFGPR